MHTLMPGTVSYTSVETSYVPNIWKGSVALLLCQYTVAVGQYSAASSSQILILLRTSLLMENQKGFNFVPTRRLLRGSNFPKASPSTQCAISCKSCIEITKNEEFLPLFPNQKFLMTLWSWNESHFSVWHLKSRALNAHVWYIRTSWCVVDWVKYKNWLRTITFCDRVRETLQQVAGTVLTTRPTSRRSWCCEHQDRFRGVYGDPSMLHFSG